MPALIAALASFLGNVVARAMTDKVLQWVAMKALLIFLFTIIVPIVLNNFMYDIIEIMMNFANGQTSGASSLNGSMNFSGFTGYLVSVFRIPECISVYVSALVLRVSLNMIPFVKL